MHRGGNDPRKVRRFVAEQFKDMIRHISRTQLSMKTSDVLDAYDLIEPYRSRRIRAVANCLPKVWEKYGNQYPALNLADDFTSFCFSPILSYDDMDFDYNFCLGAALWMLDTFKANGLLAQALALLPRGLDESDVDMPRVYDPCHSQDVLCAMVYVIQHRYRHLQSYILPSLEPRDQTFNSEIINTHELFCQLIGLLPEDVVQQAVARFRQETWAWADLYYEGAAEIADRIEKSDRLLHALDSRCEKFSKRSTRSSCTLSSSRC